VITPGKGSEHYNQVGPHKLDGSFVEDSVEKGRKSRGRGWKRRGAWKGGQKGESSLVQLVPGPKVKLFSFWSLGGGGWGESSTSHLRES